jgi:hypothetical protein
MPVTGLLIGLAVAAAPITPVPPPLQVLGVSPAATLTRSEWIARADGLFQRLDGQHQGYLDKPTLRKIFWSPDSPDGSHIPFPLGREAKFDVIDADHDGRITEHEYNDFAGRVFDTVARGGRLYFSDALSTRFKALLDGEAVP